MLNAIARRTHSLFSAHSQKNPSKNSEAADTQAARLPAETRAAHLAAGNAALPTNFQATLLSLTAAISAAISAGFAYAIPAVLLALTSAIPAAISAEFASAIPAKLEALSAAISAYLGHSLFHTDSVALVLNPTTDRVSPQYNVVFGDDFTTVPYMEVDTIPQNWEDLVTYST